MSLLLTALYILKIIKETKLILVLPINAFSHHISSESNKDHNDINIVDYMLESHYYGH